ncbi:hypothetical protein GCM10027399_23670 [Curvibacter fontanus]|jgi:hypothetical protein
MNVKLLAPAQHELDEAIAWYAAQAPGLGDAFLIETLKTITLITRHPQAWHPLSPQTGREDREIGRLHPLSSPHRTPAAGATLAGTFASLGRAALGEGL